MNNTRLNARAITEGAIMIALAQVLGYLRIFRLPQGGSVTLAMLPIFVYCIRWGFRWGMIASFAYSLLQLVLDGAYAWSWQSIIGDYLLAYTVLGVAGLFKNQKYGLFTGIVCGSVARFLVHWVVGATIWAEYMPDTFFGMSMHSPWFYSFLYNGSFIALCMLICLIVGFILWKTLKKYVRGDDLANYR